MRVRTADHGGPETQLAGHETADPKRASTSGAGDGGSGSSESDVGGNVNNGTK